MERTLRQIVIVQKQFPRGENQFERAFLLIGGVVFQLVKAQKEIEIAFRQIEKALFPFEIVEFGTFCGFLRLILKHLKMLE